MRKNRRSLAGLRLLRSYERSSHGFGHAVQFVGALCRVCGIWQIDVDDDELSF